MFLQQILHCGHVQHLLRDDPLQLGILGFQGSKTLRIASFHTAVLLAPAIERR